MSPKFTKHGEQRASERGITSQEIDAILYSPNIVALPSKSDRDASIAYGKDKRDRLWAIVFSLETGAVITVRHADNKERRFYEQQKKN